MLCFGRWFLFCTIYWYKNQLCKLCRNTLCSKCYSCKRLNLNILRLGRISHISEGQLKVGFLFVRLLYLVIIIWIIRMLGFINNLLVILQPFRLFWIVDLGHSCTCRAIKSPPVPNSTSSVCSVLVGMGVNWEGHQIHFKWASVPAHQLIL